MFHKNQYDIKSWIKKSTQTTKYPLSFRVEFQQAIQTNYSSSSSCTTPSTYLMTPQPSPLPSPVITLKKNYPQIQQQPQPQQQQQQQQPLQQQQQQQLRTSDIVEPIVGFLDAKQLCTVARVSKLWYQLSRNTNTLWLNTNMRDDLSQLIMRVLKKPLHITQVTAMNDDISTVLRKMMNGRTDVTMLCDAHDLNAQLSFQEEVVFITGVRFEAVGQYSELKLTCNDSTTCSFDSNSDEIQSTSILRSTSRKTFISMETKNPIQIKTIRFYGTTESIWKSLLKNAQKYILLGFTSGTTVEKYTWEMLQYMYLIIQFNDLKVEENEAAVWNKLLDVLKISLKKKSSHHHRNMLQKSKLGYTIAVIKYLLNKSKQYNQMNSLLQILTNGLLKQTNLNDKNNCDKQCLMDILDIIETGVTVDEFDVVPLLHKIHTVDDSEVQERTREILSQVLPDSDNQQLSNTMLILSTTTKPEVINQTLRELSTLRLPSEELMDLGVIKQCIKVANVEQCDAIHFIQCSLSRSDNRFQFIKDMILDSSENNYNEQFHYVIQHLPSYLVLDNLISIVKEMTLADDMDPSEHSTLLISALGHFGEDCLWLLLRNFERVENLMDGIDIGNVNYRTSRKRALYSLTASVIEQVLLNDKTISSQSVRDLLIRFLFVTSHEDVYKDLPQAGHCIRILLTNENNMQWLVDYMGSSIYNLQGKVNQQERKIGKLEHEMHQMKVELNAIVSTLNNSHAKRKSL
jgi:hypothetical protein